MATDEIFFINLHSLPFAVLNAQNSIGLGFIISALAYNGQSPPAIPLSGPTGFCRQGRREFAGGAGRPRLT